MRCLDRGQDLFRLPRRNSCATSKCHIVGRYSGAEHEYQLEKIVGQVGGWVIISDRSLVVFNIN